MPSGADTAPAGVSFPAIDGGRSTSAAGRAILADAARPVDPALADRIAATKDWRSGYVPRVGELTAACGRSPQTALAVARAGLASATARLTFARAGEEVPLAQALDVPARTLPRTVTIDGAGAPAEELSLPYRGRSLAGGELRGQLADWTARGVVEPGFAKAIARVIEHPEWLALRDRTVALLGAGAEMGPLEPLTRWGAHVLAVDLPAARGWQRIVRLARTGASRVEVPVAGEGAAPGADEALARAGGLDVAASLPETRRWLERAAGDRKLVVGMHMYADGGTHVRVSAAADALLAALLSERPGTAVAFLATPTDAYLVGAQVVDAARERWARRRVRAVLQAPARALSRGRLYAPSYADDIEGEDGRRWGLADALVPQQGPNYALAKRLQRWRGMVARAEGHPVSFNVAPASWTRSVTKNRVLAAAYAGAGRFGVEIFRPETTRVLMAAKLVHDLHVGAADDEHPEGLFCDAAAHGGIWRAPYAPRSVLGLAALTGLPGALRPGS